LEWSALAGAVASLIIFGYIIKKKKTKKTEFPFVEKIRERKDALGLGVGANTTSIFFFFILLRLLLLLFCSFLDKE
jgi:hypothetical protein